MDIINFLGRLHPLIVHLPIGFLSLALIVEWLMRKSNSKPQQKIILLVLILGAFSAVVASLFGWLLADSEGYSGGTLVWHRWLGIGTCVLAIIAPLIKLYSHEKLYHVVLFSIGLLLFATGHYGGSLTHGPDYLLQPFQDKSNDELAILSGEQNPDSLVVYSNLIAPILQKKCYECHNQEKDYGGLVMTSFSKLREGGDHGTVINSDPWASELFKRITLPSKNKLFMPSKGTPLDYNEIGLLKWWIEQGADSSKTVSEMELDMDIKEILLSSYKIDTSPKSFLERVEVAAVKETEINTLRKLGWKIEAIAKNNNFLEVSFTSYDSLPKIKIENLDHIKNNVAWLNLSGLNLNDNDINSLSKLKNLIRLQLNNNEITDNGLQHLSGLEQLESLNLNNNPLKIEKLEWMKSLKSLKRMYVWKSNFDPTTATELNKMFPEIKITY